MEAIALLRLQLEDAHRTLENTLGDISNADAHREPGGRAFKVAANYAHVVCAEDMYVNGRLREAAPLYASSWLGRTGLSEPMPDPAAAAQEPGGWPGAHESWARRVTVDLPQARLYAQAVHAGALEHLASLTAEDLDRPMDLSAFGMGTIPLGMVITMFVVGHYYSLAGEMSAGKGVIGLQGYPF